MSVFPFKHFIDTARLALCCFVAAAFGASYPLEAAAAGRAQARKASEPARAARAAKKPDGEAEARLIEIYRLIGEARSRDALAKAQGLVAQYPNFQLAQLVYGDLLLLQSQPLQTLGNVPEAVLGKGGAQLTELREEAQLRLRALRERPPPGTVPAQFLQLSSQSRHAIAVDTSRARLYLFENTPAGLKLLSDYYISVGKSGIEKAAEGDLRTPLGVYYVTSNLDPRSLKDFYGSGALPINYPNPYDQRRGKTGSGIWLHGTPNDQFSRPPKSTDGCVVLANPDLERIIATVAVRTTPVVIAPSLQWVAPTALESDGRRFAEVLNAWRSAKAGGDVAKLLDFYAPDVNSNGKRLAEWVPQLRQELARTRGREIELKDLSYLHWRDTTDTMVVTFGEVAQGERTGPVRRQYWLRQGNKWKIFFEGVIG